MCCTSFHLRALVLSRSNPVTLLPLVAPSSLGVSFRSAPSCACVSAPVAQATVLLRHSLSDAEAARLRRSGVPVSVLVSATDTLVPPRLQRELARALGAAAVFESAAGGHMGAVSELLWGFCAFAAAAPRRAVGGRQQQQEEEGGVASSSS